MIARLGATAKPGVDKLVRIEPQGTIAMRERRLAAPALGVS